MRLARLMHSVEPLVGSQGAGGLQGFLDQLTKHTGLGRARTPWRPFGSLAVTLLLFPAGLVYLGLFAYPIGSLLVQSFSLDGQLSLGQYSRLFSQPLYLIVLLRTVRIGATVTLACLVLGFPVALWLTRLRGVVLGLAVACLLLPLWTSVLVRSYAWAVLLQRNGIVTQALLALGITTQPLLYTEGAVTLAMTHALLPFMILPIYSVLRGVPPGLAQAAQSLGAPAYREFASVTLPLSLPGVAAGCVMVFVMALGYFVVPALLGGPRSMMISTLVNQQVSAMLNWSFAGAIGAVVLAVAVAAVLLFGKALSEARAAESGH